MRGVSGCYARTLEAADVVGELCRTSGSVGRYRWVELRDVGDVVTVIDQGGDEVVGNSRSLDHREAAPDPRIDRDTRHGSVQVDHGLVPQIYERRQDVDHVG